MKKWIALFLALCMTFALVVTASATESSVGVNVEYWDYDDKDWSSEIIVRQQPTGNYDIDAILKAAKDAGFNKEVVRVLIFKIIEIGGYEGGKTTVDDSILMTDGPLKIRLTIPGLNVSSSDIEALHYFLNQVWGEVENCYVDAQGRIIVEFKQTLKEVLKLDPEDRVFAILLAGKDSYKPGGGSGDTTGDTDVVAPKTNDLPVIALLTAGMLGFAGIAVAAKRRKV